MRMCPTLDRLLEAEKDAWFSSTMQGKVQGAMAWDEISGRIARLLQRKEFPELLREPEGMEEL